MRFDDSTWPDRIRRLPRCPARGLPKPFIAGWNPDGTVAFKVIDPDAEARLVAGRLCGLCGDPLDYWLTFLGDEVSVTDPAGVYVEPPLHEDCAGFAITSPAGCPYLQRAKVPWTGTGDEDVLLCPADEIYSGPKRDWVMAYAREFRAEWRRGFGAGGGGTASRVYVPAPRIVRTRRFAYDDRGRLAECPPPAAAPPPPALRRTQPRKKTRGKR